MTLCEKCIHGDVCNIRDCHEEGDEEALKWCSNHKPKSRFVELPCEVGQTVYVDSDTFGFESTCYEHKFIYSKYFLIGEIVSIIKTKKQLLMKIRFENSIHTRYRHKRYTVNALGKTIFLFERDVLYYATNALKEGERE